jgi:hypothetical protein
MQIVAQPLTAEAFEPFGAAFVARAGQGATHASPLTVVVP